MITVKYLCGIDYQHEMNQGADFYDTIAEVKAKKCWQECGIVKIHLDSSGNVSRADWIVPQDLSFGSTE